MGVFDPNSFLDASVDAPNSTAVVPCPEGEFIAILEEPTVKSVVSNKTGETYMFFSVMCDIADPEVTAVTGRDPTKVKHEFILDLNETGGLDMGKGKNVGLGRIREACNLNQPGVKFNPRMLAGKMVKVRVGHRVDGDRIFDEAKAVSKAS